MSKFAKYQKAAEASKGGASNFSNLGGGFFQPESEGLYGATKTSNYNGGQGQTTERLDPQYAMIVFEIRRTDTTDELKNAVLFNAVSPKTNTELQPTGITVKIRNSSDPDNSHDILRRQILAGSRFTFGSANYIASSAEQRNQSWQYFKEGLGGAGRLNIPLPVESNFNPYQQQNFNVDIPQLNVFVGPNNTLEVPMVPADTSPSTMTITFNVSALTDFDNVMEGRPIIKASSKTFVDMRPNITR